MVRRNTPAKQLVRALLAASGGAMSQDMLEEQLQGAVDRVTIYRILAGFCADGLAHRIVSDEGKAYYALCHGCSEGAHRHDHAHFSCVICRKVECMPFDMHPQLPAGYQLRSMNCWISGQCRSCRRRA